MYYLLLTTCYLLLTTYYLQAQLGTGAGAVRHVIDARAPALLYTGHCMNMLREGIFTAVYLGLYDVVRALTSKHFVNLTPY